MDSSSLSRNEANRAELRTWGVKGPIHSPQATKPGLLALSRLLSSERTGLQQPHGAVPVQCLAACPPGLVPDPRLQRGRTARAVNSALSLPAQQPARGSRVGADTRRLLQTASCASLSLLGDLPLLLFLSCPSRRPGPPADRSQKGSFSLLEPGTWSPARCP